MRIRTLCLVTIAVISWYACQPTAVRETAVPHPITEEGMIALTLFVADRVESEDLQSNLYRRVALYKLGQEEVEAAINFAENIPVQETKDRTIADISIFLCGRGELERAHVMLEGIVSDFHRSRVMAELAASYERVEEFRRGRDLTETIPDPNYQSRAFADIAALYHELGYTDLASRIFNQAVQAARKEQSVTHHVETLLYVVQKLYETGRHQRADGLFSQIIDLAGQIQSEQHLVAMWGTILENYPSSDLGESVLRDAMNVARNMDHGAGYFRDELLAHVILATAQMGFLEDVHELLNEIQDVPLRAVTLARTAEILFQKGNHSAARNLLIRSRGIAHQIQSDIFRERTLCEIGLIAPRIDAFDVLDEIIDEINSPRLRFDVYIQAARMKLATDKAELFLRYLQYALLTFERIDSLTDRIELLFDIAELYDRSGLDPDREAKLIVSKVVHSVDE